MIYVFFVDKPNHASLFAMELEMLLVNYKITSSCETTIAIRFSLFQVCPSVPHFTFVVLFLPSFYVLGSYFNVSLSLVEVPTNLNCDKSRDTTPLNKNRT